jgi:hypothetical protein
MVDLWARGNYGSYWSYHVNEDERTIDGAGREHSLFSPVLLHELGHLVMYRLVNARFTGPAATVGQGAISVRIPK